MSEMELGVRSRIADGNISTDAILIQSKTDLISNIKKWVIIDSQLKIVNEKTKKMREMKNELTQNICNYIETNKIVKKIDIGDGELKIYEKKEYSPLTYSYIHKCLEQIIKNSEHIEYIMQYIKENREIKITQDIRRTTNDKNMKI
jgi:Family of unknown function (DUF5760)